VRLILICLLILFRKEEIHFSRPEADPGLLQEALQQLLLERHVFRYDRFYSLRDDSSLAGKRIKDNQRAAAMMVTAVK